MTGKFLLDTNAVLYLLSGKPCMEKYANKKFVFSIITELECLSYSKLSENEESAIKKFFKTGKIKNISSKIKAKSIKLRKAYNLKLPDAIIAATAIVCNVPLISADKIFERITELDFIKLEILD